MIHQKKNKNKGITENSYVGTLNKLAPLLNEELTKFHLIAKKLRIKFKQKIHRHFVKNTLASGAQQTGASLEKHNPIPHELKQDILDQCVLYMTIWSANPIEDDPYRAVVSESGKEFDKRTKECTDSLKRLLPLHSTEQIRSLKYYLVCKIEPIGPSDEITDLPKELEQLAEEAHQLYLDRRQKIINYFSKGIGET